MRIIPRSTGDFLFKKTGKTMAVMLAIAMACQVSACGGAKISEGLSDEPGHGKWVDSDVKGTVKAEDEIRLQDDFAAAVNQKTIVSLELKDEEDWSATDGASDLMQSRFREALKDESLTGANAKVLRTFENLVLNWDERNKLGIEPMRKYIIQKSTKTFKL